MASINVLIADINVDFCKSMKHGMKTAGLGADYIHSASGTLDLLAKNAYSLLVVDVCLPKIVDGLELIRVIKQIGAIPILVLSADLGSDEKRNIFHAGADVYMEKAVGMEVCIAQAQALIACSCYGITDIGLYQHDVIAFGTNLVVYPQYRQVFVDGDSLHLTRTEFDMLYYLACNPRRVFSLEQIHNTFGVMSL